MSRPGALEQETTKATDPVVAELRAYVKGQDANVDETEKPVELASRAIQYSSRVGEHVLDLFAGGGSTLIAAERTGRRALLLEIDAPYCDVIVQRWEFFTGKKGQRVGADD